MAEEEFFGIITPRGGNDIGAEAWLSLIQSHPSLSNVPPREAINPFSGKPMLVHAPDSTANVTVGDSVVGSIAWAVNGANELVVNSETDDLGHLDGLKRIALEVTESLQADFRTISELENG